MNHFQRRCPLSNFSFPVFRYFYLLLTLYPYFLLPLVSRSPQSGNRYRVFGILNVLEPTSAPKKKIIRCKWRVTSNETTRAKSGKYSPNFTNKCPEGYDLQATIMKQQQQQKITNSSTTLCELIFTRINFLWELIFAKKPILNISRELNLEIFARKTFYLLQYVFVWH